MHSTHVWAVWTPRRWRGWGSPPGSRTGSSSWRCRWWGGRSGDRCSPGQRGSRPGSQSRRGYSENIFVSSLRIYWYMKKICCKNIFIKKTYFVKYFYYFEIIFKNLGTHIFLLLLLLLVVGHVDHLVDLLGQVVGHALGPVLRVLGVQRLRAPADDLVQLEQDARPPRLEPEMVFLGAVALCRVVSGMSQSTV